MAFIQKGLMNLSFPQTDKYLITQRRQYEELECEKRGATWLDIKSRKIKINAVKPKSYQTCSQIPKSVLFIECHKSVWILNKS